MAKIVPQGYADIGAYDEKDSFFKLLEMADKMYGTYTNVKESQIQDVSDSFQNLIQLLPSVSSEQNFSALETQYRGLNDRVNSLGDKNLELSSVAVGDIIANSKESFKDFQSTFNNVISEIDSPEGMFNKDNLTVENIMNWDIETLNEKYNQIGMWKTQIGALDASGNLSNARFKNYKVGDHNIYTAAKHLDNFDKQVSMALDSMLSEGKISSQEANFILTARKKDLKNYRDEVSTLSKSKINTFTSQSSQVGNVINTLQKNQEKTLFDSIDETGAMSFFMSDPSLSNIVEQYAGNTPSEINETNEGQQIYDNLISKLQSYQMEYHTLRESEIARHDKWSNVPYMADITKVPPPKTKEYNLDKINKSKLDLKSTKENMDDKFEDLKEQVKEVKEESTTDNKILSSEHKISLEINTDDYDKLSDSDKNKIKQYKAQKAKSNSNLFRVSDKDFYKGLLTSKATPGLFGQGVYEHLSNSDKEKILKYQQQKYKNNPTILKYSGKQFFKALTRDERKRILNK